MLFTAWRNFQNANRKKGDGREQVQNSYKEIVSVLFHWLELDVESK